MLSRKIGKQLKNAKVICFDVDSTVLSNEGIDELAKYLKVYKEVSEITNNAMNGNIAFEISLEKRLNIMKPSINDINSFLKKNPPNFTEGVQDFIKILQHNSEIYLVSGGFEPLIKPCAKILNIPYQNIIANKFIHNKETGEYISFDKTSFTSKTGGKKLALESIKEKYKDVDDFSMVMIGDGVTDLEAKPPADLFIGFGGITERKIVKEKCDYFAKDFNELINISSPQI